jgi:hypothetical protein
VLNDYPKFGVWPDGYYLSINQFDPTANPMWRGVGVAVFERDRMQAGDPGARMISIDTFAGCVTGAEPFCNLAGMLPADLDGPPPPAGTPNLFAQIDDDAWGYSGDQVQLWSFRTDWAAGDALFSHTADLAVSAFDSEVCAGYARNCIPQPATAQRLDAISDRLMYRLQYRNFGAYQTLVTNHTVDANADKALNDGHAGIRWYVLRNNGPGWFVRQQGDLAPDASSRWMGSIAMDKDGNVSLGYSISNAVDTYPGIRFSGRLGTDPLNALPLGESTIVNGTGHQTHTAARWGDYSSMSLSPDGCGFFSRPSTTA